MEKKRWIAWLSVAGAALGVHYLMLILACFAIQGGFSFSGLAQLIHDRLTQPGDAVRYLDIAKNGYVRAGENAINLVFYHLYPYLIRGLSWLTGSLEAEGLMLSQFSYAGASVLLYELLLPEQGQQRAWEGVLLLALYPFSMFAIGVYSEGLFLLLTIGCLYALRRRNFLAAGCVGFLAALTRVQGMLLLFPAVYEAVALRLGPEKRKFQGRDAALLLIPAGFCVYLGINYALHGDCFQFLRYEADAPWYQTSKWIGENIARQYEMARAHAGLSLIIYWPQIALYFLALAVLFWGYRQGARMSDLLYGGVYLGFTFLSGWMISGGRYMMSCVPLFILLAGMEEGLGKRALFAAEGMLFFAYSLFFLMGHAIM